MKLIQIQPVDKDIALLANAVRILNDYKRAGFVKRDSFIEVVIEIDPHFNQFHLIQKLYIFWAGRLKDEAINADLEKILEKLKSE